MKDKSTGNNISQNGKGDKSRVTNIKKFRENFDNIKWSKHKNNIKTK